MNALRDYARGDRKTVNNAGGNVYTVSDRDRFLRALTLGTTGGTFYVSEERLSQETADFIVDYVKLNGVDAVKDIVDVSVEGRAHRNTAAIFALAVALQDDDTETKKAAGEAVTQACRTFYHLSELVKDLKTTGAGWGRSKARSIASWYENKTSDQLGYQVVKYRQRGGYTHRDVMRLSHPKIGDKNLAQFMLGLGGKKDAAYDESMLPVVVQNYLKLSQTSSPQEAVKLISVSDSRVAWEFLPTQHLNDASVWEALFEGNHVGYTAMLRNINRFQKIGLFDLQNGQMMFKIAEKLGDEEAIVRERIHPISVITAIRMNNNLPSAITRALDDAVEFAFKTCELTGKTFYLGVDVSGSMGWNVGSPVTPRDYAATLAAIIAKKETRSFIKGFSHQLIDLPITGDDKFSAVIQKMSNLPFGATNASLVIEDAIAKELHVDEFIIITDNETYLGADVAELLIKYRNKFNPTARLVVIAIENTRFTVGDPNDKWTLNISGGDSAVIKTAIDFVRE